MKKKMTIDLHKSTRSREYRNNFVGLLAYYTTYDGQELIGEITHWTRYYPCVTFDDGTWAQLGEHITVDVDPVDA